MADWMLRVWDNRVASVVGELTFKGDVKWILSAATKEALENKARELIPIATSLGIEPEGLQPTDYIELE